MTLLYILYKILILNYICTISSNIANSTYIIVLQGKITIRYFNNKRKQPYLVGALT